MENCTFVINRDEEVKVFFALLETRHALTLARDSGMTGRLEINQIAKIKARIICTITYFNEIDQVVGEIFPMKIVNH